MSNDRSKFEEWAASRFSASAMIKDAFGYYFASVTVQAAWHAWQASRVAALEEAVNSIKVLIIERGSCTNLCHRDCIEEIRSLAEAPTKEKGDVTRDVRSEVL